MSHDWKVEDFNYLRNLSDRNRTKEEERQLSWLKRELARENRRPRMPDLPMKPGKSRSQYKAYKRKEVPHRGSRRSGGSHGHSVADQPRDWHGRFAEKPITKRELERSRRRPSGYTRRKRVKRRTPLKQPKYRKKVVAQVKQQAKQGLLSRLCFWQRD